jgi:ribosomal protein S18 acetylase RimI-like enzyme
LSVNLLRFNLDSAAKLNIEIRPIKAIEHQQLIDLWLECGLTRSWNNPEKDIQRKLSFQPDLLLGAFQKEQLVGSIMAGYDGHRGWMNYLGVLPNFQRQGVGKKLVEVAENGLQKLGCPKVNLQLRYSNFVAQHFYRMIGYGEDAALSFGKRLEFDSIESRDQGGSGTGGLVIRNLLQPGDLGGLIQLWGWSCYHEFGFEPSMELKIAEELTNFFVRNEPRQKFWIVEKEGQLRGMVAIEWASEISAEIRWLLLHQDQRGQGLGRKLVKELINFFKVAGGRVLSARIPNNVCRVLRFYESLGFKEIDMPEIPRGKIHKYFQRLELRL